MNKLFWAPVLKRTTFRLSLKKRQDIGRWETTRLPAGGQTAFCFGTAIQSLKKYSTVSSEFPIIIIDTYILHT